MKLVSKRLAVFVYCLLIATASVPTSPARQIDSNPAQQIDSKQTNNKAIDEKKEETKRKPSIANSNKQKQRKRVIAKPTRAKKIKVTSQIPNPISVVNGATAPEYLTGQVKVIVKGNFDPIIRLGIARNGSTVVEFPASDHFFAVHPGGGSNIVSVDESPTLATDHFLVFRAGKDFAISVPNSKQNAGLKATVSVQMESGMFVTLMFYPVSDVTQMAHRLVVIYSREEVVTARREAGLAVNLNEKDSKAEAVQDSAKGISEVIPIKATTLLNTNTIEDTKQNANKNSDTTSKAKQALQSALKEPQKFILWSKPLHGLSISTLAPVDIDKGHQLVVIAVKNTTSKSLRLIEGEPSMDILTLSGKGNPVLIQSLMKLHVETTSVDGAIPANSTIYFALAYEPPVLSVNQRIRFSVVNRNAADEPATIFLFR